MNISKNQVDALNAVVTLEIEKADYEPRVHEVLQQYRKNAQVPGFRKGHVPMSILQKQYGNAIKFDEINKLLQESLSKYIVDEKLDILGNPLPMADSQIDWEGEKLAFDFELGLAPAFEVNLDTKGKVTRYRIIADDATLDQQVTRLRKMYGKKSPAEVIGKDSDYTGTFSNEEKGISHQTTLSADVFANAKTAKHFEGKNVGDVVTVSTKGLFGDDHKLMEYLNVGHDEVHGLDIEVNFTIESITDTELAQLDQDLFSKLFGPDQVHDETEMRARIKDDFERQYASEADQKFFNDVVEFLVDQTQFDLPAAFLKKWLQNQGEKPLTADEAEAEYNRSERGIRYELIENKLVQAHSLEVVYDEIVDFTSQRIRQQMAQFGQFDPSEEDVKSIAYRVLSKEEEVRRVRQQVLQQKLFALIEAHSNAAVQEVNVDGFVNALYHKHE